MRSFTGRSLARGRAAGKVRPIAVPIAGGIAEEPAARTPAAKNAAGEGESGLGLNAPDA